MKLITQWSYIILHRYQLGLYCIHYPNSLATKGRITFEYISNIWESIDLPLNTNHYATHFISGHGNFKAKLATFRLIEDPWCTTTCVVLVWKRLCCVLAECPAFVDERSESTEFWSEHPHESKSEIVCWNPEFFRIFARVARKVGTAKEGRASVDHQE